MAKEGKNQNNKTPKQPRDYSKAVVVVKVLVLFILGLTSLFMAGMLEISAEFAKVLGYGIMAVTVYFALSSVK